VSRAGSVDASSPVPPSRSAGRLLRSPAQVTALIVLVGLLLTAAVSWSAWRIDRNNERRLLRVQTRQAATLISTAVVSIQSPLDAVLDVETATGGDTAQFARSMSVLVGPNSLFASASLWRTTGGVPEQLTSLGSAAMAPSSGAARAFVARATQSSTFVVTGVAAGNTQRIAFAVAKPTQSPFTVYAERAIPANRRVPVENDSAFSELHFATYLGSTTSMSALQTTDRPLDQLPLSGTTVREVLPFGDTTITLVTSPSGHLGGSFGGQLPWIFLAGGIVLTSGAAMLAGQLVRRRRDVERDSKTITLLYDRLDGLYAQQRSISETLQHALLPQSNPAIPSLEIASRYVAGARGVDIGGDWYSVIQIDDTHFAFVVGDVSGRGVNAAAIMARIRFTLRAYLLEGHGPALALSMCSRHIDITVDGHFATALVGIGDLVSGELTMSSAGHLNPLICTEAESRFVEVAGGVPLGVARASYAATTVVIEPGSTFIAFTDGLVERRHEDIDEGLRRLARAAAPSTAPLDDVVSALLATMTSDGADDDDIAILAFRWTAGDPSDADTKSEGLEAIPAG
jgi:serine phosphatase RsbU (regulator of sigma subunit)/type II secretory pathway pseudopilin PulG